MSSEHSESPTVLKGEAIPPKWVSEMHEHFRQHGFYRAEDLQRVLGDPRECVEVRSTNDLCSLLRAIIK